MLWRARKQAPVHVQAQSSVIRRQARHTKFNRQARFEQHQNLNTAASPPLQALHSGGKALGARMALQKRRQAPSRH